MTTTRPVIIDKSLSAHDGISRTAGDKGEAGGLGFRFWLIVLYLVIEFARPQAIIPALAYLRLPGLTVAFLGIVLIVLGRIDFSCLQTKLFVAFVGLMAVYVPFAVNNYWAFQTTYVMIMTLVAYLAIISFIDSFRKFQAMVSVWIGIHVFLAVAGIKDNGVGMGGFLADENDFALVLNMIIPFTLFLALDTNATSKRFLLFSSTALFLVCVVKTFSRGGFLGMAAVGLYCWLRSPRKLMSLVVTIILISVVLQVAPKQYWDEMATIQEEAEGGDGTGQTRIYSWGVGWRMFLDYPILGVGPGNFPWNFERYEPAEGFYGRLHGGRQAHSLYFTLIPELGFVGTILFVWMLLSSLKDLRFIRVKMKQKTHWPDKASLSRERRRCVAFALALESSVIGYLVTGIFISVLYYPCFWLWMAMVVSLKRLVMLRQLSSPS